MKILNKTRSICPICLENIEAEIVQHNEDIEIYKECEKHGHFRNVIWRGQPNYIEWTNTHAFQKESIKARVQEHTSCPQLCGLCEFHSQKTCTVLLELCQSCNLHCPVCFANSEKKGQEKYQSLESVVRQIDFLHAKAKSSILQLSGGEPTLYPNLVEIIHYAKPLFSAIQLNTNGILLAENENLAKELKNAGLSWVFLQFDGTNDTIHNAIRGKALEEIKEKAIENCKKANLSVVLVCTLVERINDNNMGELLDFALSHFPHIRGIHFQPMTFSGRNALTINRNHISLAEVIQKLAKQSKGRIKIEDALPSSCEHSLCSFHCRYFVKENQELEYIHQHVNSCNCEALEKDDAPKRSIDTTIKSWKSVEELQINKDENLTGYKLDAFDAFIARARAKTFSISCMAFQDVHTIDLERLQNCCVHIFDGKESLIPFCAYNLSSLDGKSLYR